MIFGELNEFLSFLESLVKYFKYVFKKSSLPDCEQNTVASRFVKLFEKHGVHRNQIPRFFDHGLTLADAADDEKLLIKLTPETLHAAAELFTVRLEWLEGVDNKISTSPMIFINLPESMPSLLTN